MRVRFQENKILSGNLREHTRNIVDRAVCCFGNGIYPAGYYAAVGYKFAIVGDKESASICNEVPGLVKDRNDHDCLTDSFRHVFEIRRDLCS